ncbi:23273_t:CDS:2 [Gigaspora rosea]|nr:23273_t:CDS:2 [Gigaspora rosea]
MEVVRYHQISIYHLTDEQIDENVMCNSEILEFDARLQTNY